MQELLRLADTVLQPGFIGTTPPDWLRRRLAAGLGGVALFSRNITDGEQLSRLTAALRAENPDVIVAIDEETGDVTRLEAAAGSSRPGNYALGAIDDPDLTGAVARDLGRELGYRGITLDYAPSADVNSNPNNPVIGVRSFGADPDLVSRHVVAWVAGLQDTGIAACAKHFPGHGDTDVDSHLAVPTVRASIDDLANVALAPFRAAIKAGVRCVMTGHLLVPIRDPQWPATMSRDLLTDLLRAELGFDGLIITDGIEMAAASAQHGIGGAAVRALAAGVDAICVGGGNATEATADLLRDSIVAAVRSGFLPEDRLAQAAERVAELVAWSASVADLRGVGFQPAGDVPIGLVAARRAIAVELPERLPLTAAPHVVQFAGAVNIAAGHTRWGVLAPLTQLWPATTAQLVDASAADGAIEAEVLAAADGRPLVLVGRGMHGLGPAVPAILNARPDAILVEMGIATALQTPAARVVTRGAARVCGHAAAEVLVGRELPFH
jgi:beta-N-acetylhexosaminidase